MDRGKRCPRKKGGGPTVVKETFENSRGCCVFGASEAKLPLIMRAKPQASLTRDEAGGHLLVQECRQCNGNTAVTWRVAASRLNDPSLDREQPQFGQHLHMYLLTFAFGLERVACSKPPHQCHAFETATHTPATQTANVKQDDLQNEAGSQQQY